MVSSSAESTPPKQKVGLNRRTLVRTGAHLAWSVPAVQIVTQAPAFAASGPAALTVAATNGGWTGANTPAARFTVNVDVTNNNNQPTTNLQVTFTLPIGVTASVVPPSGWTIFSGDGTNVIVLDKIDPQLGANVSTGFFAVEFNPVDTSVGNEIVVGVSASPGLTGTPGSTSTTIAAAPPVLTLSPAGGGWVSGDTGQATVVFSESRTITNTGLYQTTTGLKVVVTLPGAPFPIVQDPLTVLTTAGGAWTPTRTGDREVTFTAVAQLVPGASVAFLPRIRTQGNVNSQTGTVNFVVSATNTGSAPAGTATKP